MQNPPYGVRLVMEAICIMKVISCVYNFLFFNYSLPFLIFVFII